MNFRGEEGRAEIDEFEQNSSVACKNRNERDEKREN